MKTQLLVCITFLMCTYSIAQNIFKTNEFPMDPSKSILNWHGSSLFQINEHEGTVKFSKGYLKIENAQLWGGSFEVDMTTIYAHDDAANSELARHLKNEDFFDVKKYPTAWLSIQKVHRLANGEFEVEANLNIKGITKPILFNAILKEMDTKWQMTTKFIIDRTRWDIIYGSKGSEVLNPIKNYSISDAIKFDVTVMTH